MIEARHSLEQAQNLLCESVFSLPVTEDVFLLDALNRICAEQIDVTIPQPPFVRSPLDGYALLHADTVGACRAKPSRLAVTQHLFAGDTPVRPLYSGEAARIMTGAMLPQNADCVLGQEDTDEGEEIVTIYSSPQAMQNIVQVGGDLAAGQILAQPGVALTAHHIGLLASQGLSEVRVTRRPKVAILATGDELIMPGQPLPVGKIYNSNSYLLAARLRALGAEPVFCADYMSLANCTNWANCADDLPSLCTALRSLLAACDMVISTGGVSVGQKDYMPRAASLLGGRVLFHGLNIRPGGPAMAAVLDGKVLLALSGNPFSAAVTFEVLAAPAVKKLAGRNVWLPRRLRGVAANGLNKGGGPRRLVWANLTGQEVFFPPRGHNSGILLKLCACNCLVDIPADSPPVLAGEWVDVILPD